MATGGRVTRVRGGTVVAALVLVPLAACGGGTEVDRTATGRASSSSAPSSVPSSSSEAPPRPPAGTRWVGRDQVVVAVPADWGTSTDPCLTGEGDLVRFDGPPPAWDCAGGRTEGSSLLVGTPGEGAFRGGRELDLVARIDGTRVLHSGIACRASLHGPCSTTMAVPESGVAFRVHYSGDEPEAFVEGVRDSLTTLDEGWTTVPFVELGRSREDALAMLADAGLEGWAPDVSFPHYATGTVPSAGSVVAVGSEVELTIGDG
jgi:hypothetical protein